MTTPQFDVLCLGSTCCYKLTANRVYFSLHQATGIDSLQTGRTSYMNLRVDTTRYF